MIATLFNQNDGERGRFEILEDAENGGVNIFRLKCLGSLHYDSFEELAKEWDFERKE